ncbi:hypothetical protein LSPH24S_00136 [Lysinibacillus sphaericus]
MSKSSEALFFFYIAVVFKFSNNCKINVTVAGQLTILYDLPFWATWFTVGVGELLSMTVGGVTIYLLNKKIDLSK